MCLKDPGSVIIFLSFLIPESFIRTQGLFYFIYSGTDLLNQGLRKIWIFMLKYDLLTIL